MIVMVNCLNVITGCEYFDFCGRRTGSLLLYNGFPNSTIIIKVEFIVSRFGGLQISNPHRKYVPNVLVALVRVITSKEFACYNFLLGWLFLCLSLFQKNLMEITLYIYLLVLNILILVFALLV